MNPVLTPEIHDLIHAVHYRPAVSIIMPFEPKMGLKAELTHSLKLAVNKVEQQLQKNYPKDICGLVMQKLRSVIKELNYNTHKNSLGIFISPVFEKVLYLDIAVEERIIIDESFEIRDLVYSKKQHQKYLVLALSAEESRVYLGNSNCISRIVSNTPNSYHAFVNDMQERIANFSDMKELKQIVLDKFLRNLDNSLDIILKTYHLPLFVLGTEKILGHFKQLTKHAGSVIEYVHGNYDDANLEQLKQALGPHIADWKKFRQRDIVNQLEDAAGKNKLAAGIRDVWQEAMRYKGRLLVVEQDYMYVAEHGSNEENIYKTLEPYNKFSYIKDAVDDVIEKVLENGGDVEFADAGVLKDYHHIALIQNY
jgi:hypothetical protein